MKFPRDTSIIDERAKLQFSFYTQVRGVRKAPALEKWEYSGLPRRPQKESSQTLVESLLPFIAYDHWGFPVF